jgi:cyanoexosortase B-associated protein
MKTIGNSQFTIARYIILALLLILILIKATPNYLQGKWSWQDLPKIANVNNLQNLRKTGLNISQWQTIEQKEITIGGRKWSFQVLTKQGERPITLLLQPQTYYKDYPGVEWVDINGLEKWKTDSLKELKFMVEHQRETIPVTARFFRAWNQQRTYAVIQWYAMANKGHFSSGQWFWTDIFAQLKNKRTTWVAVSLKMEIEPLGDIKLKKELAETLGKTIQTELIKTVFNN